MSYKLFPTTFDYDQLVISFGYEEELNAFERVLKAMKARVGSNNPRHECIEDFKFNSILEMKVAEKHITELRQIIGLAVLNIFHRYSVIIIPFSEYIIEHKNYWFPDH